jgi:hypothetical protein
VRETLFISFFPDLQSCTDSADSFPDLQKLSIEKTQLGRKSKNKNKDHWLKNKDHWLVV